MKQTFFFISLIFFCAAVLSACGQTGKLYLPDNHANSMQVK